MRECYRFIVTGRVQGVFFRQSARDQAARLNLVGWVRNRPDGAVEGRASGTAESLRQFQRWLHQGPPAARVDAVEWIALETAEPAEGFEIRR